MTFSNSQFAGVNLLAVDTSPVVGLGTIAALSDGGSAIYVQASAAITQYAYCLVISAGTAAMATTTTALSSKRGGWAQVAIASGSYGWLQISGTPTGLLAASCAANVPLYTTATAGVLDDATVAGALVLGAISTVTITTAAATPLLVGPGQMVASGTTV